MPPISLRAFPRAILHIDGDSFFASIEQSLHSELKGRPVVTGKERGIASAVSIEAKKLGIKRAMSIRDIKKICPNIIHLPSDYETYSLFSKRMFEIVRRYTGTVEEYSIDECFAEITGLRRPLKMNYKAIAEKIKNELENDLGITFSIGLAPSKVLAKIGSKWNKPSGLTIIPGNNLHIFLSEVPIGYIWGIGTQTTAHMNSLGISTALDFAEKDFKWVENTFTKPHQEIWHELRGNSIYSLETKEKRDYKSISKAKTFTPPSNNKSYIFSQLSKNVENACIKARRHGLLAQKVFFMIKTQEYEHEGFEFKLSRPTNTPNEIITHIEKNFPVIFRQGQLYRQTGVVLLGLVSDKAKQMGLFEDAIKAEKGAKIYESVDKLAKRYGKHVVFLGTSFQAMKNSAHNNERGDMASRKKNLFRNETTRKRLGIPFMGDVL